MTSLNIFKLYARPTFLEGMARVLDLSGSLTVYNFSETPEEADIRALRSDWEAIGKDLQRAIENEQEASELSSGSVTAKQCSNRP